MIKILIIDDDARLCRLLARYLEASGFIVAAVNDAENMRLVYESFEPTIVILDLNLPDSHGLELTQELRGIDKDVGILILTGSENEIDGIVGLETGADDYVKKPIRERELLARTRSLARRIQQTKSARNSGREADQFAEGAVDSGLSEYGQIQFNSSTYEARTLSGEPIDLTTHEFRLLLVLAQAKGRVLSRDQLLDAMYGRSYDPLDRSVDVLIAKIRKKLSAAGLENPIITVRGAGYKFNPNQT